MKISEVIERLQKYQRKLGDVELLYDEDDGRSSWSCGFMPQISEKRKGYFIDHAAYGKDPKDV